jgi:hypothetical protein
MFSHRDNGHKNQSVNLSCLQKANDNLISPIKFLLIMALMLGIVDPTTADGVPASLALRKDKRVVCVNAKNPVFYAFKSAGVFLDPTKPAGNHQLTAIMKDAGLKAGLLVRFCGHDLRRGTARDNANRKSKIERVAAEAVLATVGHSTAVHQSGTALYTGPLTEDGWPKRVEENFEKDFSVDVTDTPFKKRRKLNVGETEMRCEIDGLDSSSTNHRRVTSRSIYRHDVDDSMLRQRDAAKPPPDAS